jgi:hypothetical protein
VHFYRPDLAAPERLSLTEAALASRRGVSKLAEIRELIRARRLRNLPEVCNGRQAAWALVVPPYIVSKLIASGRLPAEKVFDNAVRFHFEIYREDVFAIAEELS